MLQVIAFKWKLLSRFSYKDINIRYLYDNSVILAAQFNNFNGQISSNTSAGFTVSNLGQTHSTYSSVVNSLDIFKSSSSPSFGSA